MSIDLENTTFDEMSEDRKVNFMGIEMLEDTDGMLTAKIIYDEMKKENNNG